MAEVETMGEPETIAEQDAETLEAEAAELEEDTAVVTES